MIYTNAALCFGDCLHSTIFGVLRGWLHFQEMFRTINIHMVESYHLNAVVQLRRYFAYVRATGLCVTLVGKVVIRYRGDRCLFWMLLGAVSVTEKH